MNTDEGRLSIGISIDNTQLRQDAAQSRAILEGIGTEAEAQGRRMDTSLKDVGRSFDDFDKKLQKVSAGLAGFFVVQKAKDFATQVFRVRGEFQQLEMAFKTMLGSAGKADALMSQLIKTAATTPFGMDEVATGAKQLLAYGVEADKVNDTLIRLGDIAAGLSIPLNDLSYLYGTTMVQGRMYTQDLNQFLGRGIPLTDALAETMGVAKDKVRDLVTEGKVGFPQVEKAIEHLTDKGSKFGGLMAAQSQTLTGQWSNIEDGIEQMLNEMGRASEGVFNKMLAGVSAAVDHWREIGKVLLAVATAFGTYKAAVMAASIAQTVNRRITEEMALQTKLAAMQGITLSRAQAAAAAGTTTLARAFHTLKVAFATNPLGIVLTAVTTLISALTLFGEKTDEATDTVRRYGEQAGTTITRIKSLQVVLSSLNTTSATYRKTLGELNAILQENGLQTISETDTRRDANDRITQTITLLKEEAATRQQLDAIKAGADKYADDIRKAQEELMEALKSAEIERIRKNDLFGSATQWLPSSVVRENAEAIFTIITQVVDENMEALRDKSGKGMDKIVGELKRRLTAAGIDRKAVNSIAEWSGSALFNHSSLIDDYMKAVQRAQQTNDSYTESINRAADAARAGAVDNVSLSDSFDAIRRKTNLARADVATFAATIRALIAKFSDNAINFHVRIDYDQGHVPAWMDKIAAPDLRKFAENFANIYRDMAKRGDRIRRINGQPMSLEMVGQRAVDYANAAELRQQQADEKARAEREKAEAARQQAAAKARARAASNASSAQNAKDEKQRLATEAARRSEAICQAAADTGKTIEETELDLRQKQIDLREESYEKQRQQIELNYDRLKAENKKREQDMLNALADVRQNQWLNSHPKATETERIAHRRSLTSPDSPTRLTRSDLLPEQQQQLQAYDDMANAERARAYKNALEQQQKDFLTYQNQRLQIAADYDKKLAALYETGPDGQQQLKTYRGKDEQGNDVVLGHATQQQADQIKRSRDEAISTLDEQIAAKQAYFNAWVAAVTNLSTDRLRQLLATAKDELAKLEADEKAKPAGTNAQALATARAKVTKIEKQISDNSARDEVNKEISVPGERTLKQWKKLHDVLSQANREFEALGDSIGGVAGEAIKVAAQITTSTLTMINGIMSLGKNATEGIKETGEATSKTMKTVEKASIILSIISTALEVATKVASLFNKDNARQKEIDKLQASIDHLQWEIDNPESLRLIKAVGEARTNVLAAYRKGLEDVQKQYVSLARMATYFYVRDGANIARNEALRKASAQHLADFYAKVDYSATKALAGRDYTEARDNLERYAEQMQLVEGQLENERNKRKTDEKEIERYTQKLEELQKQSAELIANLMDDIVGASATDIAGQLSDAFFEAFGNGEKAAQAWADKVNDIVADIFKRMVTKKFLEEPIGAVFDKYKKQWFGEDGRFNGLDDIIGSLPNLTEDLKNAYASFDDVYKLLEQLPEDLRNKVTGETEREGTSRGIAQASQDSVDELNARMTTVQSHTYGINENTKRLTETSSLILESVLRIEGNTKVLPDMAERLSRVSAGVDDITRRGVTIKT